MRMPEWFRHAAVYEIYPQSFLDTNGDGIGDLQGVLDRLDYVKELGCNAIWLNPCFDSPMQDGGYDVRDYTRVASRYGTNEDLERLFAMAHAKGMHVLLDLVPGHTSEQHPWFRESQKAEKNEYSDRYIWTSTVWDKPSGYHWICGPTERDGCAMVNFFNMQPALNYGFGRVTQPWQKHWYDPACQATLDAVMDVMRFWLQKGCDGFRVDMADSLVKDDPNKEATAMLWQRVQAMLEREYPEAVLVAEWSNPQQALTLAGFQGDFYLSHDPAWPGGGYATLVRDGETSFFHANEKGNLNRFLNEYLQRYTATRQDGYICLITGNHDTRRIATDLEAQETRMAYSLLLTLPGVPFVYAGDEIGMRHLNLVSREGGFNRTGDRTPMQWNAGPQYGFSTNAETFLPQDMSKDAPTVAAQQADEGSLWRYVQRLLNLRATEANLQPDAPFEAVWQGEKGYPFVYRRGNLLLALNASAKEKRIPMPVTGEPLLLDGAVKACDGGAVLEGQTFVIWRA